MTQAPTPGPLSEDDVNRECKACGAFKPDRDAVCTFCGLAPTAPVEASGSEREHGPKCWGKTSISDEMMYCYCGSTDSPPGETREALDRLKMAAHVYEDDEMAADCETLEALLSTRPLALGGQQGVARWGLKDDNGVIQCLTYDDKTSAEVAANRCSVRLTPFPLYATPARAEAQDEGAAGRIERWITNGMPDTSDHTPHSARLKQDLQTVIAAARAHPSPTPAADADADRVREKAAFVQGYEDGYSDCSAGHDPDAEPNWTSHLEALAALKSEGGK